MSIIVLLIVAILAVFFYCYHWFKRGEPIPSITAMFSASRQQARHAYAQIYRPPPTDLEMTVPEAFPIHDVGLQSIPSAYPVGTGPPSFPPIVQGSPPIVQGIPMATVVSPPPPPPPPPPISSSRTSAEVPQTKLDEVRAARLHALRARGILKEGDEAHQPLVGSEQKDSEGEGS